MALTPQQENNSKIEWPTLILFVLTYSAWLSLTALHAHLPISLVLVLLIMLVTLHSSLQHEVIHGHPTPWPMVNTALAFPALGLAVAYPRYELMHLQHHRNWLITDPYDDSESYFVSHKHWASFSLLVQRLLNFNNSLFGRLSVGPAIMIVRFFSSEFSLSRTHTDIRHSWLWHLLSSTLIIAWLVLVDFSILLYVLAVAYPAISVLMLRSFSEHLPEENIELRSAIVKTNWLMQLLYLNNNYHRVHHDHPEIAWYRLPELYRRDYQHHTKHVYNGYSELFVRYGFKQRYAVEHPFLGKE